MDLLPDQKVVRHISTSHSVVSPDTEFIFKLSSSDRLSDWLRGQEFDWINFFDFHPDREIVLMAKSRIRRRNGKIYFINEKSL